MSVDFDGLFNNFHHTVSRLEALPSYNVGGAEGERIAAFRGALPRPLRNVSTDKWLERIALTTISDGKRWERVRVVDDPLTEYQRYQLASHQEAQACGETVLIARRAELGDLDLGPDVWVFDAGTDDEHAAVMRYDGDGRFLGAEVTTDVAGYVAVLAKVREVAIELNEFLAELVRA
jgi:hypothetical protein